jgi:class 3 adenylate cyclase
MAARLDPEEWHEIAREYQREASVVVERFGGHVAKFLGDGVLVFLGGLTLTTMTLNAEYEQVWRCLNRLPR